MLFGVDNLINAFVAIGQKLRISRYTHTLPPPLLSFSVSTVPHKIPLFNPSIISYFHQHQRMVPQTFLLLNTRFNQTFQQYNRRMGIV